MAPRSDDAGFLAQQLVGHLVESGNDLKLGVEQCSHVALLGMHESPPSPHQRKEQGHEVGGVFDAQDAAVKALTAGVNMEMSFNATVYLKNLANAVKQNQVSVKEIDDMVRPLLETKIKLGLFENPYVDEAKVKSTFDNPAHREAAKTAAERSAVLLKNQNNLLPLSKTAYKKIAVIGPLADSRQNTLGSWSFAMDINETATILAGLKTKLGTGTQVEFAPGVQISRTLPSPFGMLLKEKPAPAWTEMQAADEFKKAVDLAKNSDIAVMVLGENQDMSGESASRSTLDLPGRQLELLQAVTATGKPVVLVLLNGRPLDIYLGGAKHPLHP